MDLHNEVDSFMKLKRVVAEEGFKREGADFKCAGIAATIENGWPVPVVLKHDGSPEVRTPLILPFFQQRYREVRRAFWREGAC